MSDTTEPRTIDFYLGAHLTYTVDAETGRVIHLEIMPYQEPPRCEQYPEWVGDDWERVDAVFDLANDLGWVVPGLNNLPDDVSWEV